MSSPRNAVAPTVLWSGVAVAVVALVVVLQRDAATTDLWYSVPRLVAGLAAIALMVRLAGSSSLVVGRLGRGLLLGVPALVVAVLALLTSLSGGRPTLEVGSVAVFSLSMLSVGVFEEGLFRGLLLDRLGDLWPGALTPVVLSSVVFGLAHGANAWRLGLVATSTQIAYAVLIGVFFAAVRLRSGGLAAVIVLHAVLDWCFYLVSDVSGASGAAAGSAVAATVVPLVLGLLLALWGAWLLRTGVQVRGASA